MNNLAGKFREVFLSVFPIAFIVLLLKFTIVPIDNNTTIQFLVGFVFVVFGLTLFLIGVDIGITPLSDIIGTMMTKTNKLVFVLVPAFILGFIIAFAEPGLNILGNQIELISSGGISSITLVMVVSIGIGTLMMLGFLRIVYNIPLYIILNFLYLAIFILAQFTSPEFLAIAFDSQGAVTGILTVPFLLSLAVGVSELKKDRKASEKDSFGFVSIVATGAVLSVLILNLFVNQKVYNEVLIDSGNEVNLGLVAFVKNLPINMFDSLKALFPLIVIFVLIITIFKKIHRSEIRRITFGFIYAVLGIGLFFLGANTGFMRVGAIIGRHLVSNEAFVFLILVGFFIGVVTLLAEPAVHVLTQQIEEVTAGFVKRESIMVTMAIGVGVGIALSLLRILFVEIQLWHFLLPGYLISLILTFFVPKLFVGIAFDGSVCATGPITATFILSFINGAALEHNTASVLIDGFGVIAMIALMPIITLQILGLLYRIKSAKKEV